MPRHAANSVNGLSAREEKFAGLIAEGMLQAQAYRIAFDKPHAKQANVANYATKLANRDVIKQRVRDLLQRAEISKIDSIAKYHADVMADVAAARAEGNWTAVAALLRLRGQTIGALQDKTVITDERVTSDEQLIKKLAGGDEHKAAMLRAILGDADAYKT